MALSFANYEIRVFLKDQTNTTFTKIYQADPALVADDTEAATAAAALIAELAPVTALTIVGYTIGKKYEEDGAITLPQRVGYDQASISVALETPNKFATIYIPGASNGIFQATTGVQADVIDVNDADLLAYVALWKDSTGYFYLSDGEHVAATATPVVEGERISKKGGNS